MSNNTETSDECIVVGDKVKLRRRGKKDTWVAHYHHNGQHRKRSMKTSNRQIAHKRAIILEAELASGDYVQRPRAVGIEQAVKEYLESKRGDGCRPKTMAKYTQWLADFTKFAAANDARYLGQINVKLYELFRASKAPNASPKSRYTGLTIIRQFVGWVSGRGREYLSRTPLMGIRMRKPPAKPAYAPSTEQVHKILDAASGDRKLQYAILAMTGLRAGELVMLRPRDVDLDGGWIHVAAREGWQPKTGASRTIPIPPKLREMLATVPKTSRPYFFCASPSPKYPDGGHQINPKHMLEDFQKLAKKLEFPVGRKHGGIVIHSLRHYFKTVAIDSGIPNYVTDAWMGHSDPSMGRQYYHLPAEKKQAYMQQVQF
jgi:integrase